MRVGKHILYLVEEKRKSVLRFQENNKSNNTGLDSFYLTCNFCNHLIIKVEKAKGNDCHAVLELFKSVFGVHFR